MDRSLCSHILRIDLFLNCLNCFFCFLFVCLFFLTFGRKLSCCLSSTSFVIWIPRYLTVCLTRILNISFSSVSYKHKISLLLILSLRPEASENSPVTCSAVCICDLSLRDKTVSSASCEIALNIWVARNI